MPLSKTFKVKNCAVSDIYVRHLMYVYDNGTKAIFERQTPGAMAAWHLSGRSQAPILILTWPWDSPKLLIFQPFH